MAVRKLSPSTLKKLFAPFSNPLHLPFINPPSISQNFTKTQLFAKPFSSQPGLGNEAIVTQQRSNYVASGRAEDWKSCAELASDNEIEWVCWEKPEEGFIKVNVSVVFCLAPVKLVMIAGVYRDSSVTSNSPWYNPSTIPLAASEGYLNVVIESVNKEVVDTITKYMKAVKEAPNEPGPDFSDMKFRKDERESLELIASLVPQGGTYRFAHIYKEANRVAGLMAMNQLMKEVDEERIV
ncbi:hypothetical protein CASFOL_039737 [Castilleja foliolosa]|uniref:Uncharacterized protein n=1 Tax=Castilleja foliolosa TaxID=1961234 RepID=A0ABD3BGC4_9LAMI